MEQKIKEFIETHIDQIENNEWEDFYTDCFTQNPYGLSNYLVRDIINIFSSAGLQDTTKIRYQLLYNIIEQTVKSLRFGEMYLSRFLNCTNFNNWFGFTKDEVIQLIKENSDKLHVELTPYSIIKL